MAAVLDWHVHLHRHDCDRLGECGYCEKIVQPDDGGLVKQADHGVHYLYYVHLVSACPSVLPPSKFLFLMILSFLLHISLIFPQSFFALLDALHPTITYP
jgi:hypothetical protein